MFPSGLQITPTELLCQAFADEISQARNSEHEMVSAMAVLVVSSFCCPLSVLEVLLIALQHRLERPYIKAGKEGGNNAQQPLFSLV